jgi:ElaB/YqjD/DUF883 family membrane-anchored ribosome-binding protein
MANTQASTAEPIDVEVEDVAATDDDDVPMLDKLEDVGHRISEFVVERPLTAVAIAATAGFLIGRLFRR